MGRSSYEAKRSFTQSNLGNFRKADNCATRFVNALDIVGQLLVADRVRNRAAPGCALALGNLNPEALARVAVSTRSASWGNDTRGQVGG